MSGMEDKILRFVVKYYDRTKFDTDKAIARFRKVAGIAGMNEMSRTEGSGMPVKRNAFGRIAVWSASVAAVLALGLASYMFWHNQWSEYKAIDIARTFVLPDSTDVTLAPGAVLRLQPHKDARLVSMTGKVYFDVKRDESRPFRIIAGNGLVKVLGTCFQVRQSDLSVKVDVVSGKVLFSSSASKYGLMMTAGMSAELSDNGHLPEFVGATSPNPVAWATGEFVYANALLSDVIRDLEEYYGVKLSVLSGGDLQDKRLTARFDAGDLSEILSLIEDALSVKISR